MKLHILPVWLQTWFIGPDSMQYNNKCSVKAKRWTLLTSYMNNVRFCRKRNKICFVNEYISDSGGCIFPFDLAKCDSFKNKKKNYPINEKSFQQIGPTNYNPTANTIFPNRLLSICNPFYLADFYLWNHVDTSWFIQNGKYLSVALDNGFIHQPDKWDSQKVKQIKPSNMRKEKCEMLIYLCVCQPFS